MDEHQLRLCLDWIEYDQNNGEEPSTSDSPEDRENSEANFLKL